MKGKPVAEQEIGKQLLQETVGYAETSVCRRKTLLHYFGEVYDEAKCNAMCDNCRNPKQKFEAEESLSLVLDTVLDVKEKFKAKHVVQVLMGTKTAATKSYKHEALEVFGKGSFETEKYWMAIIRQALVNNYLEKDIENYGLLGVTEKGKEFLENPHSILFTRDTDYDAAGDDDEMAAGGGGQRGGASDETLFALLKDLRKKIAKQKGVPPYVVFQDPSLEDMAIQYPINMEEMKQITGVGSGKALRFGKEFVDLITKYVEENDITRPMDMVVKSVVNKSGAKVYIIQSIDRKLSLGDIANAKGMSMDEVISEIESIVSSGTKVNISYYINSIIDDDKQEEIYEYFKESETDSIIEALKELGEEDYTEEEIRLVRIKFIAELGH
jgi:ATP-dependent DNA helicase RecQ